MRIHTDRLTEMDFRSFADDAGVRIELISKHGSRKRKAAFEIHLGGSSSRNAMGKDFKAATWDEWGLFISAIYVHDLNAIAGDYENAEHFHWATAGRFENNVMPADTHQRHEWNCYSLTNVARYFECSKCDAEMRLMMPKKTFADV